MIPETTLSPANIIVKKDIELITEENSFVHVSGHPNRDDLKDMYNG